MIQKFVDQFINHKVVLAQQFLEKHPDDYMDLVHTVIKLLSEIDPPYDGALPDPDRIHEINDGDYQGTLVYVIGCQGYQPSTYWYVRIDYGSCSGCDTLLSIRGYGDDAPDPDQVDQYMMLALHIVQRMKQMDDIFNDDGL